MKISRYSVLTSLLALGVVIEALSAVEWGFYPYFPDKSLVFARIDAAIFSILAPFSPTFLILLLYTWPFRLAVSLDNQLSRRLRSYSNWLAAPLLRLKTKDQPDPARGFMLTSRPRLLLLVAVVSAALLGLVPYRLDLNPSMTPVGVDAHFYVEALNQMLQRAPAAAFSFAMRDSWAGTRPLFIITMYLTVVTGLVSVNQAVEALPTILGPLLAVSTFIFVRAGSQNERVAGVASVLSVLSFNTTVGMWAGFYANWLALTEAYLFLAALLVFFRNASATKFVILTLLSLGVLLTHPWTWVIVMAVAIGFVVTVWRDAGKTILLKPLGLLFTINILADFTKSQIYGGLVAAQIPSTSLSGSSVSQTLGLWPNLISGIFFAYEGLLGDAILLALPMIAMLFVRFKDRFERLLALWVALGSLAFPVLPFLIWTRILYDMPLPIMTSISLLLLIRPAGKKTAHANLAFLLVLLLSANYALRAVTNLVAVPF